MVEEDEFGCRLGPIMTAVPEFGMTRRCVVAAGVSSCGTSAPRSVVRIVCVCAPLRGERVPPTWSASYRHHIRTGLQRSDFDNKSVTFEEHVQSEHNMWHYLYFIVLIKVKVSTEFTGPESYVYNMVQVGRPCSLDGGDSRLFGVGVALVTRNDVNEV